MAKADSNKILSGYLCRLNGKIKVDDKVKCKDALFPVAGTEKEGTVVHLLQTGTPDRFPIVVTGVEVVFKPSKKESKQGMPVFTVMDGRVMQGVVTKPNVTDHNLQQHGTSSECILCDDKGAGKRVTVRNRLLYSQDTIDEFMAYCDAYGRTTFVNDSFRKSVETLRSRMTASMGAA